jgi:hypothetical protein
MTRRFVRTLLTALVLGLAGIAAAWSPVPGMELLLTDLGARSLVGYGVADDASLRVELSVDRARLQVLLALPGGDVRSLVGELADGRVWFWDGGRWQDLASVLAADGYELVLVLADGRSLTVAPAPGTSPPGVAAPRGSNGATPRAQSDDDDDGADDDARDDGEDDGGDGADGGDDDPDDGDDGGDDGSDDDDDPDDDDADDRDDPDDGDADDDVNDDADDDGDDD